ncbi:MAG: MBL fold metallo-hydrolase [Bacteroidota bacterium]
MMKVSTFEHGPVQGHCFLNSPFGYDTIPVHVYLVDGLLVDTASSKARPYLEALLKPQLPQQIVLTHHHEDHSGNVKYLKETYGLPAFASAACARIVAREVPVLLYQRITFGPAEPVQLDLLGPTVETDQYQFEVIPCPGHSADHIALYEKNQGWLFSGDMYIGDRIRVFKSGENMSDTIASLQHLLTLDFDTLFCAHRPRLKKGPTYLRKKLDHLQALHEEIWDLQKAGYSLRRLIKKLSLKESYAMKYFSGGDVSLRNLVVSALESPPNSM